MSPCWENTKWDLVEVLHYVVLSLAYFNAYKVGSTCAKEDKTSSRLVDYTDCVFCPCFSSVAYGIVFTEV